MSYYQFLSNAPGRLWMLLSLSINPAFSSFRISQWCSSTILTSCQLFLIKADSMFCGQLLHYRLCQLNIVSRFEIVRSAFGRNILNMLEVTLQLYLGAMTLIIYSRMHRPQVLFNYSILLLILSTFCRTSKFKGCKDTNNGCHVVSCVPTNGDTNAQIYPYTLGIFQFSSSKFTCNGLVDSSSQLKTLDQGVMKCD